MCSLSQRIKEDGIAIEKTELYKYVRKGLHIGTDSGCVRKKH